MQGGIDIFYLNGFSTIGASHVSVNEKVSGSDEYFLTFKLSNNWKLKGLYWYNPTNIKPGYSPTAPSAQIDTNITTNPAGSPYVKINWKNDGFASYQAYYYLGLILIGPKGVPYH